MNVHLTPSMASIFRRVGTAVFAGSFLLAVAPSTALAEVITVELNNVSNGTPGSTVVLVTETVAPGLIGVSCSAHYAGLNNSSVHPGNNLIVSTGASQVTLTGVEDFAGKSTTASGTVVLGSSISVSLRRGPDGQASLGSSVVFDCVAPIPVAVAPTTSDVGSDLGITTTTTMVPVDTTVPAEDAPSSSLASGGPVPSAAPAPVASVASRSTAAPLLPSTGSSDANVMIAGAAFIAFGTLLMTSRRRISQRTLPDQF